MRRFLSLFTMLMLTGLLAFSQSRVVSGKVTDADGNAVPFATVKIKGTATAISADANGSFSIKVSPGAVLVLTAAGFKTAEVPVGTQSQINTVMEKSGEMEAVIVTSAFQTKRTQRSVSSNAQVVTGEQVNTIRQTNVNNALAGKVAGLQVRSQSTVSLDGGASIRLGGESGFSSGSVLYVVDGTQMPNANDISADDVEDYTVLQGPSATALYGPAGQNGVVVITLKKARKFNKGIGLEINTGVQFDKLYILPNYQNSYSGGSTPDMILYQWKAGDPVGWKALDGKYFHNYNDDASWGPRMAGQEYIPWYAWYPGSEYSFKTAKLTPKPSNSGDFFNTGVTKNTNVNFSKAGDNYSFRASYSNLDVEGLMPNSSLKRNMLTVNGSIDLNSHFTFSTNINYVTQVLNGIFTQAYSNQSTGSFNSWFHRDLDMNILRELKDLTYNGKLASWNIGTDPHASSFLTGNYWYNFYSYFDNKISTARRDRLYGNMALTYKVNNDLSLKLTYRKAQNTTFSEDFTTSLLEKSASQTGEKASYGTQQTFWNKQNIEGLLSYNKKIRNFSIDFNAGFDLFSEQYRTVNANTVGGLTVDNLYALNNSVSPVAYGSQYVQDKYRAIFATGAFGYKNFLFIDGTARQDYFSTLPANNNGIFSKSAGISFVFSDFLKKSMPWLSYGKIKAAWGEVPGALGGYNSFYGAYLYPGSLYTVGANQWTSGGSSYITSTTPDGQTDPAIRGAVAVQKDFGLEMSFLKNRVGFTALYKEKVTKDFPYSVGITGTSGISTKTINTGEIRQKSFDATLNLKPFWTNNFKWELNATFSKLIENKVVSIAPGITSFVLSGGGGAAFSGIPTPVVKLGVDLPWGSIIGGGYTYGANGKPIIDSGGSFINDPAFNFGSVLPDYTGGVQNTFTVFKNFIVNVNIDYQVGGKFFSLSDMWGSASGLTARTAVLNDKGLPIRDPVADGGGVHVFGVNNISGKDYDIYVEAKDYFGNMTTRNVYNDYIYDLTFVKLRELSIGYKIPVEKLSIGKYLKAATFSVTARNPWLIYAKTKDFDPSEISSVYGENGQFPGTRSIGFNLKLGF